MSEKGKAPRTLKAALPANPSTTDVIETIEGINKKQKDTDEVIN
jgi:hypothetical protein